jgi:hypothetical protein
MTDICDNMLTSDHISDIKLIWDLFKIIMIMCKIHKE